MVQGEEEDGEEEAPLPRPLRFLKMLYMWTPGSNTKNGPVYGDPRVFPYGWMEAWEEEAK